MSCSFWGEICWSSKLSKVNFAALSGKATFLRKLSNSTSAATSAYVDWRIKPAVTILTTSLQKLISFGYERPAEPGVDGMYQSRQPIVFTFVGRGPVSHLELCIQLLCLFEFGQVCWPRVKRSGLLPGPGFDLFGNLLRLHVFT